jgi:hypothetical protein
MEAYQLYLTDKHQLTQVFLIVISFSKIDKASHLPQLVLAVGWNSNLGQT